MELRDRDALDYLVVGVVTVLVYLELPWRPAIRGWLRDVAATLVAITEFVFGQPVWVYVIAGLLLGVVILVALVELPNRTHA